MKAQPILVPSDPELAPVDNAHLQCLCVVAGVREQAARALAEYIALADAATKLEVCLAFANDSETLSLRDDLLAEEVMILQTTVASESVN